MTTEHCPSCGYTPSHPGYTPPEHIHQSHIKAMADTLAASVERLTWSGMTDYERGWTDAQTRVVDYLRSFVT